LINVWQRRNVTENKFEICRYSVMCSVNLYFIGCFATVHAQCNINEKLLYMLNLK